MPQIESNLNPGELSILAGCETEHRILDAGLALFIDKGYSAIKDDDIAHAAGVSVDLVRKHFATKETLFCMVLDRESEKARNGYSDGVPEFDTSLEALRFGLGQYKAGAMASEMTALWQCALTEKDRAPQLVKFFISTDGDTQVQAYVRHIVQYWVDKGLFKIDNLQHFSRQLVGMLNRVLIDEPAITGKIADDLDEYIESCCQLLANTYGTR